MHDALTPLAYCQDAVGHGCFAVDLDGHVQAFVPSVRDRLIERGVLHQDADHTWRLRWHGLDLDRERAADMACCDFCSARPVAWVVPCASFALPSPAGGALGMSEGDWAACQACGAAVAAGDKATLLRRAQPLQAGPPVPELAALITSLKREVQRRFWAHYRGGAVQVTPHPYGH